MLSENVRQRAGQAIAARFRTRDEALKKALYELAVRVQRDHTGEEKNRVGVQLRMICERDLVERANVICEAVQNAHKELDGVRRPRTKADIVGELDSRLRAASLALAGALKVHARDFRVAFRGNDAIDAEWIARLRQRAADQQREKIENYVARLKRGLLRRR